MLGLAALAILAAAVFFALAYTIAWCLAKSITAYQDAREAHTARAHRESEWNARRSAQWGAW